MNVRHRIFRTVAATIASLACLTSPDAEANTQIAHDVQDGSFLVSWWGEASEFYFIQQSEDLADWHYVPVFEVGDDEIIAWGFRATAPKLFFRLVHTDDVDSDLMQSDFDGDGLTVHQEYLLGSDPFNPDTSGDGIFDGIAAKLGTSLTPPEIPASNPADNTAPTITLHHPHDAEPIP